MFIHQPPHAFETIDFPIFLFNHLFKHPTKRQLLSVRFRCVFQPSVVKYHTQQCVKPSLGFFCDTTATRDERPIFAAGKHGGDQGQEGRFIQAGAGVGGRRGSGIASG